MCAPLYLEAALERVDIKFGSLGVDGGIEFDKFALVVVLKIGVSEIGSLSQLPIGLPIELIGSDKDSAVFLAGREDDHIRRYPLIGFDLYNIAHFQIFA